jgi:hypothetical protein
VGNFSLRHVSLDFSLRHVLVLIFYVDDIYNDVDKTLTWFDIFKFWLLKTFCFMS